MSPLAVSTRSMPATSSSVMSPDAVLMVVAPWVPLRWMSPDAVLMPMTAMSITAREKNKFELRIMPPTDCPDSNGLGLGGER